MEDINKLIKDGDFSSEEELRISLFATKGIVGNTYLKDSVDNDRIVGEDVDGVFITYPSLDRAAEIITHRDPSKKTMVKFRIRKAIINQTNEKIFGFRWSEESNDYLKRVK